MGEAETPYFYDCGIFGRVPTPQTNHFYLLGPQDTKQKSRKILEHFIFCIFANVEFWKPKMLTIVEKTGAEQSRRSA